MKKNVALFDSSKEEAKDFIKGLELSTSEKWEAIVCNSNKGRNKISNIIRYIKYFIFPFHIFINRKKYNKVIGWQAFYGLNFAFYCNIFKVKKQNFLLIKNFTYKPKKGIIGKIYDKYMNFIINSNYVDVLVCTSETMVKYCQEIFPYNKERFVAIPFGVNDFSKNFNKSLPSTNNFILSLGRSNRDWHFIIDAFKEINEELIIICDNIDYKNLPPNIKILKNVHGDEAHKYIYNCFAMIIPIENERVASGETVLLKAMSFSKPIIITKPSCLANDYIKNEINGISIEKNKKMLKKALEKLKNDKEYYRSIAKNAREYYNKEYSLMSFGKKIGNVIKNIEDNNE